MNANDATVNWIAFVPLIGGMPLSAEKVTGRKPMAVYSYDGFLANDSQYMNYQNNTLGNDIDYITISNENRNSIKESIKTPIDLIVLTCPCAGLSNLNTSKNESKRGESAEQNEHLYNSARDSIELFDAKVIIGENAPALGTKKGKPVRDKLNEIAKEHGYAFATYKTSTHFHGIPQRRDRTFYMMYKSKTAPILNFIKKPCIDFDEYVKSCENDSLQRDLVVNKKLKDESYYKFLKFKFDNPRAFVRDAGDMSTLHCIQKKGLVNEALEYFQNTNDKRGIKHCSRLIEKKKIGLGVWDCSTKIPCTLTNAIIGRNMNDSLHPYEERSLNVRECFHLMGFPNDFELVGGVSKINMIAQNVPVCTASDLINEMVKFINDELELSNSRYIMQDNWHEKTVIKELYVHTLNDSF